MGAKPKHAVLSDWIRDNIREGIFPEGSRLLSENELSQRFSVSRQTVRQAIATLVNEGLLERRRGSGTYVSGRTENRHEVTKNIAVITTYLDQYIFPGIIQGIDQVLAARGYNMKLGITYNQTKNEAQVLSSMLEGGIDGLIIEPTKSALPNPNIPIYQQIQKSGVPIIFLNGYYSALDAPCVRIDDYTAGKMATEYLISKGHTRLFGIFKSDDVQGHFRFSGFVNTVRDNRLVYDDHDVLWYVTEDAQRLFSARNDNEILERISGSTAAVCYNDEVACRFCECLRRGGVRVPDDYSVVSFDNSHLATIGNLNLTTVDYPVETIGMTAAKQMTDLLAGTPSIPGRTIEPRLVVRDSVKSVKKD